MRYGFGCIKDPYSPCECCGRCGKRIYRSQTDERHNETYNEYSDDDGETWYEDCGEDYD